MSVLRDKLRGRHTLGAFAGVVVSTLLLFLGAGIMWGLWRPSYTATVVEGGTQVALGNEVNVEFGAYGLFILASIIITTAVVMVAYFKAPHARSFAMLLWLGIWAFLGAQLFIYAGEYVSGAVHGINSVQNLQDGEQFAYVPYFAPGVVAHVVAPFWAVLVYWCLIVVGSGPYDPDDDPVILEANEETAEAEHTTAEINQIRD